MNWAKCRTSSSSTRPGTACIQRPSRRSSASAWSGWSTSPASQPAWPGTWRLLQGRGTRWSGPGALISFRGRITVRTVVLLSKGEINTRSSVVEFSLEDMDMSGFQKDATYGQIKERVLQQTGLKVSSLYIAQVKQKYGIIERENYNKPKSENARQPKCPPEKEAAITEALKYFGMI